MVKKINYEKLIEVLLNKADEDMKAASAMSDDTQWLVFFIAATIEMHIASALSDALE